MKWRKLLKDIKGAWDIFAFFIVTIIPMVYWVNGCSEMVKKHPIITVWILFFLVFFLFVFGRIILKGNWNHNIEIKHFTWKHYVLIIDDDPVFLRKISDYLTENIDMSRIELVSLTSIPHYKLAESFEIVISDIIKAGAGKRESVAALNAIKNAYPYKIVLAMSSNTNISGLKIDEQIIPKRENYDNIKNSIINALEKLENVDNHWKETELYLNKKNMTNEEILNMKKDYYSYIKNKVLHERINY